MKQLAFSWIAFLLTFGIGSVLAWPTPKDNRPESAASQPLKTDTPIIPKKASADSQNADFVAEFTNVDFGSDGEIARLEYGAIGGCALDASVERNWIVMFRRGDRYFLERRRIDFGPRDYDGWGGYFPMRFKDSNSSLFLITDTGQLRPGEVKTIYQSPTPEEYEISDVNRFKIETGFNKVFSFGNMSYRIRVTNATSSQNQPLAALILETDGQSQVIWYKSLIHGFETNLGEIDWLGDLDGDGKLDLHFVHYAQNGGGRRTILFVSSVARPGEMVNAHAFHYTRRAMDCE